MKKKMGILGGLLMAVVVTAYSVAGTYAKYTTSFDYSDEARVAQWNFVVEDTNTVDLFQSSYTKTDDNGEYTYVKSADKAKVVAPGTSGEYVVRLSGTAETNYKLSLSTTIVNNIAIIGQRDDASAWDYGDVQYNPLEFSFDGINWFKTTELVKDGDKVIGLTFTDDKISDVVYEANTNANETVSIYWRWPFSQDDAKVTTYAYNDNDDTALGEMVKNDSSLKITATMSASAVQTTDRANAQANVSGMNFTKKVSNATIAAYEEYGFVRANIANVRLNENVLSGTMVRNDSATLKKLMGRTGTGYYYPMAFTNNDTETVKMYIVNDALVDPNGWDPNPSVKTLNAGQTYETLVGLGADKDVHVYIYDATTEDADIKANTATPKATYTIENNIENMTPLTPMA